MSTGAFGAAEARRRLGLWETAMMVRADWSAGTRLFILMPMMLMVFGSGVIAFVLLTVAERNPTTIESPQLAFYGSVAVLYASMGAVTMTLQKTRALAFLRTLPPLHAPRALLLAPLFAVGLALSVLGLPFVPPLAALAFLGWWCFAATIGHRFAGHGGLVILFVALPLSFLGPGVSALAYCAWQWPGAALTSLLLAAVGYATSPRDRARDITLRGASVRSSEPSRASVVVPRPRLHGALAATLRAFNHCALFGGAVRMPRVFPLFILAFFAFYGLIAWTWPIQGFTTMGVLYFTTVLPATWLGGACLPARLEFLASRPLRAWQRRWASSLALVWGVLLLSALAPLRAIGLTTVDPGDLRKLPYPTAIIDAAVGAGARGAPAAAPSAASPPRSGRRPASPVPVSPALRRLLIRFIGIVALLHWGMFSGLSALFVGHARKARGPHLWLCGFAAAAAPMLALFASFGPKDGALAPMWLAALLAAVGTFELRRSLRLPLRG